MQSNIVETLVGAVVIAIAAGFLVYGFSMADIRGSNGYTVTAAFDRVDGLANGSDVRMSGIKVGTVIGQRLDPQTYQAVVVLSLRPEIKLPTDSNARITSEGLLGGNYVSIMPGGSEDYLAEGEEIMFTQGSVDLMGLIGQAIFSAQE